MALRGQVEDLQKKLSEKDELLKEVEISKNEMASTYAKLDEMKKEYAEKDSLLKSTQAQLSDAKVIFNVILHPLQPQPQNRKAEDAGFSRKPLCGFS